MKKVLSNVLIIFFLFISSSSIAQKSKLYLQEGRNYSKGKIFIKKSLIPVSAKQISLVNDTTITYTDTETGLQSSLHAYNSSVNYIKVRTGSRTVEFGLYGAGIGLASSVLALLQTELDYGTGSTSDFAFPFIAGFTAGGAVIGGLIGVFTSKYKNFYIKDRNTAYKLDISPALYQSNAVGLGMRVTF